MGHSVPTFIGVDQSGISKAISKLVPSYMAMGSDGMAEMSEMAEMGMALPENTLPMMMGRGQFGALEMGGMFSVVKVHPNIKRGDYTDPGWYQHPKGTVASEWNGSAPEVRRAATQLPDGTEVTVRKPSEHSGH